MRIGRYDTLNSVSNGGSGIVYRAVDTSNGTLVAVKVLREKFHNNPIALEQFRFEANQLLALDHPNIVKIKDYAENPPYLVMEFIEGKTLEESIFQRRKPYTEKQAINIILQVLQAINYAHNQTVSVLHLDLKPSNIMINDFSQVKVIDFGISTKTNTSLHEMFVGSPYYMSPEQVNKNSILIYSDIYSIGITFYYLLTSHVPFDKNLNLEQVYTKIIEGDLIPITAFNPNISPRLVEIISKCTSKFIKNRFNNCNSVINALSSL
jgi:serine/threonine-protein kinase